MSDQPTRSEIREVVYFDAVLRIMKDYAVGEGRAIPKEEIWESAIRLWDRTNKDFSPPTISWYNTKHPRYRDYCAELEIAILYSRDGIFIAETPEEVAYWEKNRNEPYIRGVEKANNKIQETIADKGFNRDGLRLPYLYIRRLLGKPDGEIDGEEE